MSKGPRLTIEEINAFNPSPERPLEVECDDGHYKSYYERIKIISKVEEGVFRLIDNYGGRLSLSVATLIHYPSIKDRLLSAAGGFQVGDKVRAFGCDGVVRCTKASYSSYKVEVDFDNIKGICFTSDGRYMDWHKEPSLILIERPVKKVKKSFWLWAYKDEVSDTLMDETGKTPTGKTIAIDGMVKLPGTEVVLEVTV